MKGMINLIPNVYQAAYMQNLANASIKKQVETHKNLFNKELSIKSEEIYQMGIKEGMSGNPLNVESSAYTVEVHIHSLNEERNREKDKRMKFGSVKQLFDFMRGSFDLLPEPIKTWRYWKKTGEWSKTYLKRLDYFTDRYNDINHKTATEAKNRSDDISVYGFELDEMKVNNKLTSNLLLRLFDDAPTVLHPDNGKVNVKYLEFKKYARVDEKLEPLDDYIKIYKFIDLKDSKLFSDLPTELKQLDLIKVKGNFPKIFENVFGNIGVITKPYKPSKSKVSKSIKSDIDYNKKYRNIAIKGGLSNKDQLSALSIEKENDLSETERKALEYQIDVLSKNPSKAFIKNEKGNYALDFETEGDKYDETTNKLHIQDIITNSMEKTNKDQLEQLSKLLINYKSKKNTNPNKYDYIREIEEKINALKGVKNNYWGIKDGDFDFIKMKKIKNVTGLPPKSGYFEKMKELEESRKTKTNPPEKIESTNVVPTVSETTTTEKEEMYEGLFPEESDSEELSQAISTYVDLYRQSNEKNKTREGAKSYIFKELEIYRDKSVKNGDDVNAFISLNQLHFKGMNIKDRDLIDEKDIIYLPFDRIKKKFKFGVFEFKLTKSDRIMNDDIKQYIGKLEFPLIENLKQSIKSYLSGPYSKYKNTPKLAEEVLKLNGL